MTDYKSMIPTFKFSDADMNSLWETEVLPQLNEESVEMICSEEDEILRFHDELVEAATADDLADIDDEYHLYAYMQADVKNFEDYKWHIVASYLLGYQCA